MTGIASWYRYVATHVVSPAPTSRFRSDGARLGLGEPLLRGRHDARATHHRGSVRVGEPAAPAAVVHSVLMTAVRGSGRLAQPIRYSTVTETASSGAPGSVGTDVGSLTAGSAPGAVGGTLFGTIIGTA
jgi:hypothetical protein